MTTAEYRGLQKLILGVRDELKEDIKEQTKATVSLRSEMNRRFDEVYTHFNARFDEVDRQFSKVDERFDEVDRRFTQVDNRFDEAEVIQNGLFNMVGAEHNEYERRLTRLEAKTS